MPTDICLAHLVRRDWLTDGPLNELIGSYVERLQNQRYARSTRSAYLRCLAHFSYWMQGEGLGAAVINRAVIERFLQHHLPTCPCPAPCRSEVKEMRVALHHLQDLLPEADEEGAKTSVCIAAELKRFDDHLRHTCCLAPLTRTYRCRHVAAFLASCFGTRPLEIGRLTAGDIDAFLKGFAARWKPASCKVICTSLCSYFCFRTLLGDDTQLLSASLSAIANWPRRHPPKILTESQIQHFLHAFDMTDPVGLRDHAIARCLLDLGLRGDEATHLTLGAVDWLTGGQGAPESSLLKLHSAMSAHSCACAVPLESVITSSLSMQTRTLSG